MHQYNVQSQSMLLYPVYKCRNSSYSSFI